jgi:lysophospholipase L1-like esterase
VKKWAMRAVLALLGVSLGLVLVETMLRTFYPQYGGKEPGQFHPILGVSLIPNFEGVHIAYGHENVTNIHTNSLGFRDSEVQIPKPENVFRILVLGDSMTFGLGVMEEEAFPAVLEDMLNGGEKAKGVQYEIVNAGVPGYGTAQELLQYQLHGPKLNPDLVILAFLAANDLLDNLCVDQVLSDRTVVHSGSTRPCFALRNGELAIVHGPQRPQNVPGRKKLFPSANRLHTWVFIRSRVKSLLTGNVDVIKFLSNFANVRAPNMPGIFSWYMDDFEKGWPLTEQLLDKLEDEVAHDGAKLVVVVFPDRPQTTHQYLTLTRVLFEELEETAEFMADSTKPQDLFLNWGEKEQVPVFDCLPGMREAASTQPLNLQDGHFNPAGHRVVAGLILNYLTQNGLIIQ